MPLCQPRGCGCQYTSETLSIYPDPSNSSLIHFEQAEPSIITELQDDVTELLADVALLETMLPATSSTWTPTLTNITRGTGFTEVARYVRIGPVVHLVYLLTLGSGGSVSGDALISLPVNFAYGPLSSWGRIIDSGTSYQAVVLSSSATLLSVRVINAAGTYGTITAMNGSVPAALGSGDTIQIGYSYFAA